LASRPDVWLRKERELLMSFTVVIEDVWKVSRIGGAILVPVFEVRLRGVQDF